MSTINNKPEKSTAHPLDAYSVQPQQAGTGSEQSPYYKSAAPSVGLPKGGGALKGIDEKFSVNAVNGTAGLDIPFPLTPGRGGFTPALSVSYSSGSGNSEFGLGFGLSLPAITRKTDKKLPLYDDVNEIDVFLLAGAEDLVPLLKPEEDGSWTEDVFFSGAYFIRRYRPRIEGLYARIELIRKTGTHDSWWRVTTRDNLVTYYGLTAAARIADPEDSRRIYKWLPELMTDHKGNVQQYFYVAENLDGVQRAPHEYNRIDGLAPFTNTYLKRIAYCNKEPFYIDEGNVYQPLFPADPVYLMEAVLDYGDHSDDNYTTQPDRSWNARKDPFSSFQAGFEIRCYRRCHRVLMFHAFKELGDGANYNSILVRSLELGYQFDSGSETMIEADFLTKAVLRGYVRKDDGNGGFIWHSKAMPAMTMDYEPLQWDTTVRIPGAGAMDNAPQGLSGPYQWMDLHGEGISGILTEQAGAWFYKENLGDGSFSPAMPIVEKPSVGGFQWADLDADGRRQVVSYEQSLPGYYELNDDQEWEGFRTFGESAHIDWSSPYTKMLDLDGDGRADVLLTEDNIWTWFGNKGTDGFVEGGRVAMPFDEEKGPRLLLNDNIQRIFLADMNGDGMTDLVRIMNGSVSYWPNKGYGQFGAKVTMSNAPLFDRPDLYNPLYLHLADISGTGAPDLLYRHPQGITAWINCGGNGFSAPVQLGVVPAVAPDCPISVLDFTGNGTSCIVWSSPLPQHTGDPLRYIDLMGGRKPHLLKAYTNGMGKKVTVSYRSSTHYYLEDKLSGRPWATRLPFPVHCVEQIVTTDQVSETRYTQRFRYRHGYYDHPEREFRGFGYVETIDTDAAALDNSTMEELNQPPVLTKTWYHTGAWIRERTLLEAFGQEYYKPQSWQEPPVHIQLPGNLTGIEEREAYRSLKGLPLRQEIYAQDGTDKEAHPYSVTATAYCARMVQPREDQRYACFQAYQEQSIAWSSERDPDDPRIAQQLTLEVDEYGHELQSAAVAYPRLVVDSSLPVKVREEQARMHITCSETQYTNDVLSHELHYRLRLPYEAKGFELSGATDRNTFWTAAELKAVVDAAAEIDNSTVPDGTLQKRLLAHTRSLFLEDDLNAPLSAGMMEALAIPYESYTLAFTPAVLDHGYGNRVTDAMLAEGAYKELNGDDRWWIPSGTAQYSATPKLHFYTPVSFKDPWGNTTSVTMWDGYFLLPEKITDALGNENSIGRYNWRNLQPERMKDLNDNISELCYDALGMPVAMALLGKGTQGDDLDGMDPEDVTDYAHQQAFWNAPASQARQLLKRATWRCVYNLEAFAAGQNHSAAVAMIARTKHVADGGVTADTVNADPYFELLMRVSYSDGFGRVIMHKAQAAPEQGSSAERWSATGRTIYNNKGNVVLQYEPYFSSNHLCDTAEQAKAAGVTAKVYYDPLGRAFRTDMPDGTFSRVSWTGWMQQSYDANDTVLDSEWYAYRIGGGLGAEEQDAAEKTAHHALTPVTMHLDSLARPFYTIVHNRTPDSNGTWQDEYHHSYAELDIEGQRLAVHDALGRIQLQYRYSILNAPMQQESIDGGVAYMLVDAAGQPMYAWDAEDRITHLTYDELHRPSEKMISAGGSTKLTDVWYYGEMLANGKAYNRRGRCFSFLDGAGQVELIFDFKGNAIAATRYPVTNGGNTPDWNQTGNIGTYKWRQELLNPDALNRPYYTQSLIQDPAYTRTIYFGYDRSGASFSVGGENQNYYNALGQPIKVQYLNGTQTTYEYDPLNFRTRRIRTIRGSDNAVLQDLYYWYDAAGNITLQRDEAQQTVFFDNQVVEPLNDYTYDALYRLVKAKGREHAGNGGAVSWNDAGRTTLPHKNDGLAMRNYTQTYTYDAAGNMLRMKHVAGSSGWTRNFDHSAAHNRLLSSWVGTTLPPGGPDETYGYDARGNMISGMTQMIGMVYNDSNQLQRVNITADKTAYYQYDGGGQRLRKLITVPSQTEERIYGPVLDEYRKTVSGTLELCRITTKIQAAGVQVLIDARVVGTGVEPALLKRYQYSNHLGSASLELDDTGAVISYEEYYPYGSTSFQSGRSVAEVSLKRYRYTGKERDEETGLYYHGARYYAPWLVRWTQVDPLEGEYAPWSPYNYSLCNPITLTDPTGMGVNEPIAAPKMLNGATATYTFVRNVYDHTGQLKSSESQMTSSEIKGLEHGEYVTNVWLPDPNRPTINDGSLRNIANLPTTAKSFTPYGDLKGTSNSSLPTLWDMYKAVKPVEAGILNGTWNFAKDALLGAYWLVKDPVGTVIGLGKLLYAAATMGPAGIPLTPEALQLNMAIGQTLDKFADGDAYTKSSMTTYAALTIGSFFVGGEGEVANGSRVIGELGWSSKSLKLAEVELNAGKPQVWVTSQAEAEELLLAYITGKNHPASFRNTTGQVLPKFDEYGNALKKSEISDWLPEGRGALDKRGTYHWDSYNPDAALGDHARTGAHVQIHDFRGFIFRIFYTH